VITILLATAASVLVKMGLSMAGPRQFGRDVVLWSSVLLVASGVAAVAVVSL